MNPELRKNPEDNKPKTYEDLLKRAKQVLGSEEADPTLVLAKASPDDPDIIGIPCVDIDGVICFKVGKDHEGNTIFTDGNNKFVRKTKFVGSEHGGIPNRLDTYTLTDGTKVFANGTNKLERLNYTHDDEQHLNNGQSVNYQFITENNLDDKNAARVLNLLNHDHQTLLVMDYVPPKPSSNLW